VLFGLAVILLGLAGGGYTVLYFQANGRLREAITEADRLDPGWRMDQLEAKRPQVPDDNNAALRVIAAKLLLPGQWPRLETDAALQELKPFDRLDERQADLLRSDLKAAAAALAEAHALADLTEARYPLALDENWVTNGMAMVQDVRRVANLLAYDARLLAHDGDGDAALRSCHGVLQISRSLQDQPTLISFLVRAAIRAVAARAIERTLARVEASEEALAVLQQAVAADEASQAFLHAMRGERALVDLTMSAARSGQGPNAVISPIPGSPLDQILGLLVGASTSGNHAAVIRLGTQVVEIAKLPAEEQPDRVQELKKRSQVAAGIGAILKTSPMIRLTLPAYEKTFMASWRSHTDLRCVHLLLACERFRRANGDWPASLEELTPKYLAEVPRDPFDGSPLRYRRTADGVIVYSVSVDGKDDGGEIDKNYMMPGSDYGYRLWDAARRRQPTAASERPAPKE
jgi:hypothetical protein